MEKLIYKLLVDMLSLVLLVFSLVLIAEGVVPGYISGHLSFTRLTLVIVALILSIVFLGKRNSIQYSAASGKSLAKNKITLLLVIIGIVLIVNSMFGMSWLEVFVISAIALFILYTFFQILLEPDKG